jgi:hypothetical protein
LRSDSAVRRPPIARADDHDGRCELAPLTSYSTMRMACIGQTSTAFSTLARSNSSASARYSSLSSSLQVEDLRRLEHALAVVLALAHVERRS